MSVSSTSKRRGCLSPSVWWIPAGFFVLLALTIQVMGGRLPAASPATTAPPATLAPTAIPVPKVTLSPEAALRQDLEATLTASNRNVPRIEGVAMTGGFVQVEWSINDNALARLTRTGAYMDAVRLLRIVHLRAPGYEQVRLVGSFSMEEPGGKVTEMPIMWVEADRTTLATVNWEDAGFVQNVLHQRLDELVDVRLHPEFAK